MKQTSTEARIIALEAQLRIYPQPKRGDVKLEGETPETVWGRTRGTPAGIFQAMGGNYKEPSQLLWSSKEIKINMICVNKNAVSCANL